MDQDDEPPSLIDVRNVVSEAPSSAIVVGAQMQGLGLARVPITVVTGKFGGVLWLSNPLIAYA